MLIAKCVNGIQAIISTECVAELINPPGLYGFATPAPHASQAVGDAWSTVTGSTGRASVCVGAGDPVGGIQAGGVDSIDEATSAALIGGMVQGGSTVIGGSELEASLGGVLAGSPLG